MGEFVTNAITRKELEPIPIEMLWAIAFAPLYLLVEFHMNKRSFRPGKKFVFTDEVMNVTLDKIVKALKP